MDSPSSSELVLRPELQVYETFLFPANGKPYEWLDKMSSRDRAEHGAMIVPWLFSNSAECRNQVTIYLNSIIPNQETLVQGVPVVTDPDGNTVTASLGLVRMFLDCFYHYNVDEEHPCYHRYLPLTTHFSREERQDIIDCLICVANDYFHGFNPPHNLWLEAYDAEFSYQDNDHGFRRQFLFPDWSDCRWEGKTVKSPWPVYDLPNTDGEDDIATRPARLQKLTLQLRKDLREPFGIYNALAGKQPLGWNDLLEASFTRGRHVALPGDKDLPEDDADETREYGRQLYRDGCTWQIVFASVAAKYGIMTDSGGSSPHAFFGKVKQLRRNTPLEDEIRWGAIRTALSADSNDPEWVDIHCRTREDQRLLHAAKSMHQLHHEHEHDYGGYRGQLDSGGVGCGVAKRNFSNDKILENGLAPTMYINPLAAGIIYAGGPKGKDIMCQLHFFNTLYMLEALDIDDCCFVEVLLEQLPGLDGARRLSYCTVPTCPQRGVILSCNPDPCGLLPAVCKASCSTPRRKLATQMKEFGLQARKNGMFIRAGPDGNLMGA